MLAVMAAGAAVFIAAGLYDVAANVAHTQPVHSLLELTMQRAVKRRAAAITAPPLGGEAQLARGALCFRDKCVQCHGGPGQPQGDIGRSMQPLPGPLVDAPARWRTEELYWITRNGIKLSGMPAWEYRLSDADLWALVAFVELLPRLTAAGFAQRAGPGVAGHCDAAISGPAPPAAPPAADAARGRIALTQYACNACHRIPGVTGSDVHVGPPLAGIGARQLIAGSLPNTPQQLERWIRAPRSIDPQTAMPDLQVSERDARDMAAYLSTLR